MHSKNDPTRLRDNPHPKWDVPLHLIEWQPAYAQQGATGKGEGVWQPTWKDTDSSKCIHLIQRLNDIGVLSPSEKDDNKAIVFTPAVLDFGMRIAKDIDIPVSNLNELAPLFLQFL